MKILLLKSSLLFFLKLIKIIFKFLLPKNINNKGKNTSERIFLINFLIKIQNIILKSIRFPLNIYRTNEEDFFVEVGGVFLDTSQTFRYFKLTPDTHYLNQGEGYNYFFKKTKKKLFIDIGSHIGEISIYIAKNYENAKIISVEGSPKMYQIQKKNISLNKVNNIKIYNYIMSDKNSDEYISDSFGTENFTLKEKKEGFVKNKSIKLMDLIKNNDINQIDFLKIDIEGSIPKLSKDLTYLWKNKKINFCALSIEKNSFQSYFEIIDTFTSNSIMYEIDPNSEFRKKISKEYLVKKLKKELGLNYQSNRFNSTEVVFEREYYN